MTGRPLYAVQVLATADEDCAYAKGTECASLVIVRADSLSLAEDAALIAMSAGRWLVSSILSNGPVVVDPETHPGVEGDAIRYAAEHGFAIISYPE